MQLLYTRRREQHRPVSFPIVRVLVLIGSLLSLSNVDSTDTATCLTKFVKVSRVTRTEGTRIQTLNKSFYVTMTIDCPASTTGDAAPENETEKTSFSESTTATAEMSESRETLPRSTTKTVSTIDNRTSETQTTLATKRTDSPVEAGGGGPFEEEQILMPVLKLPEEPAIAALWGAGRLTA